MTVALMAPLLGGLLSGILVTVMFMNSTSSAISATLQTILAEMRVKNAADEANHRKLMQLLEDIRENGDRL